MNSVFDFFFTGTATIRRPPAIIAGGKRSTGPYEYINILCTPIVGVTDDEARRQLKRPELETPLEIAQVFASSAPMPLHRKGDDLILGGRVFPIRHTERWPLPGSSEVAIRIIVEKTDK